MAEQSKRKIRATFLGDVTSGPNSFLPSLGCGRQVKLLDHGPRTLASERDPGRMKASWQGHLLEGHCSGSGRIDRGLLYLLGRKEVRREKGRV